MNEPLVHEMFINLELFCYHLRKDLFLFNYKLYKEFFWFVQKFTENIFSKLNFWWNIFFEIMFKDSALDYSFPEFCRKVFLFYNPIIRFL